MKFKTDYIRRIGKKMKSKRGTTLVEMIATVAILSIVATMSLQAMVIANEEYRRVDNTSASQRSVSLMQKNFNAYLKNATEVQLVDYSADVTVNNVTEAITKFRDERTEGFSDSEYTLNPGEYNDYILYRSGAFEFTLSKYYVKYPADPSAPTSKNNTFVSVFTVTNVKEINFALKTLSATQDTAANIQYELDYIVTAPTSKELVYTKSDSNRALYLPDENSPTGYDEEFKNVLLNNLGAGDYNVLTGTVLNNMYGDYSTAVTSLRISEGMTDAGTFDGSHKNFVFIRTYPKADI